MDKVRWGILSDAKIGREKVIPAIQKGELCDVVAIASRDMDAAQKVAALLGIPTAYGTYEALLSDPKMMPFIFRFLIICMLNGRPGAWKQVNMCCVKSL